MMRDLYLVRHGQVDFPNNIRRCIGWTDLPLSPKGKRQGQELGKYFRLATAKQIPVFTSPLKRASETAELLAEGNPVLVEEGLKELNMGEWENIPMSHQDPKHPGEDPCKDRGRHYLRGPCRLKQLSSGGALEHPLPLPEPFPSLMEALTASGWMRKDTWR